MNCILLTPDGEILSQGRPVEGSVLRRLSSAVETAEGYTLRSFFRLFERYPALRELNEFLPSLLERALSAPDTDCRVAGVESLVLLRTVEMIGFPGKPRMEIYTTLQGRGPEGPLEIRFMQVEDLLDTPLVLGPLRHVVLGDEMDVFEFETVYTLFEFLEGVSWELSFHGTPLACKIDNNAKR